MIYQSFKMAVKAIAGNKMRSFLTILGVVLSTMHQSSLGALFLIAPSKMHPLWYSPFMPVFFFIS